MNLRNALLIACLFVPFTLACSDSNDSGGGQGRGEGQKSSAGTSTKASNGTGKKTENTPSTEGAATTPALCAAKGSDWFFDAEERECVKVENSQSGAQICSTKGSGWTYDEKAKACVSVKPTGGKGAEEACKSKGTQWYYDSANERCVESLETRDAAALCKSKEGADAIFVQATGECKAKGARLALAEAPRLALVGTDTSICSTLAKPNEVWIYRSSTGQCVRIGGSVSLKDFCAEEYGDDFIWYSSSGTCSMKDESVSTASICAALARSRANAAGGDAGSAANQKCVFDNGNYGVAVERLSERELCDQAASGSVFVAGDPGRCEIPGSPSVYTPQEATVKYSQLVEVIGEAAKGTAAAPEGSETKEVPSLQCPAESVLLKMTLQQQYIAGSPAITAIVLKCVNLAEQITEVTFGNVSSVSSTVKEKTIECPGQDGNLAFPNGLTVSSGSFINDVTGLGCVAYDDLQRMTADELKPELDRLMTDKEFEKNFDYDSFVAKGFVKYTKSSNVAIAAFPATAPGALTPTPLERSCNKRVEGGAENIRFLYGFKLKYFATTAHPFIVSELSTICTTVSFTATSK